MALVPFAATFELKPDAAGKAPTRFILLKQGLNDTEKGPLVFDDDAAKSVMANYKRRKIHLTADYEHQSLIHPPIKAPASAKQWEPVIEGGALVAANVQWTATAAAHIEAGEYNYFSIACLYEEESRRVRKVVNFGLTNLPAANEINPLMAASFTVGDEPQEINMSKVILVALGLNADLDESAAVSEAAKLVDLRREVFTLTGKTSVAEAMGAMVAMKSAHEQVIKLTAQLDEVKAATAASEIKSLLDHAQTIERKVAPAKRVELEALADKYGVDALRVTLSMMSPLVDAPKDAPKEVAQVSGQYTAEEIKIASVFVGSDRTAIAAHIDAVRADAAKHAALTAKGL